MIFTRKYFCGEKIFLFKAIFCQKNTDVLLFFIHELETISNIKKTV